MNELTNLKAIIDEELSNLVVTKKLEKRVFKGLSRKYEMMFYVKHNWMRLTTVFSLIVILFTLGINTMVYENNINEKQSIKQNEIVTLPENKLFMRQSYFERFTTIDDDIELEENQEVEE